MNKSGGELSGVVDLTRDQVIDVYAGTHLPEDKKNASVNGEMIVNSGIANYILMNIGVPLLAMHSAMETMGAKDLDSIIRLMEVFFSAEREVNILTNL